MRAEVLGGAALIAAAMFIAKQFDRDDALAAEPAATPVVASAASLLPRQTSTQSGFGHEVRLAAGPNHQYFVTAAVNSRPASFLVDTGASYVALRASDAEAANVYVDWRDYKHRVRTANGETKAALVSVEEIEIDGIRVENVDAFVLPDDQLGMNLLGMSFLSKLESVTSKNGELVLKG